MVKLLPLYTFGAMDIATAEGVLTDDTAGGIIGLDHLGRVFLLENWVKNGAEPLEIAEKMFLFIQRYNTKDFVFERNRFEYLRNTLYKLIERGAFAKMGTKAYCKSLLGRISTVHHTSVQSKKDRIEQTLHPLVKIHNFYVKKSMTSVINQFQDSSIHDDILDWIQMAVAISFEPPKNYKITSYQKGRGDMGVSTNTILARNMKYNPYSGVTHFNLNRN